VCALDHLIAKDLLIFVQIEIERIITCLPLEFRGSDPVCSFAYAPRRIFICLQNLRRNMEGVIEGLMNAPGNTVKCQFSSTIFIHNQITQSLHLSVTDLIKPPDLSQARVNKCLIALVNRKAVQKENNTVHILFFATLHNLRRSFQGTVLYHWQGIP
jgi:DASH complex subunit DAM1